MTAIAAARAGWKAILDRARELPSGEVVGCPIPGNHPPACECGGSSTLTAGEVARLAEFELEVLSS